MDNPTRLRAHAVQLFTLALQVRHSRPAYAALLVERTEELERQATAIEEAAEAAALREQ